MSPQMNIVVLFIGLALFPQAHGREIQKNAARSDEDHIRETVIRDVYKKTGLELPLFIEVEGHDPDSNFLERFAGQAPVVKPRSASRSVRKHKVIEEVLDKKTKARGIVLSVGKIHWRTSIEVEVSAGYYCGSLCSGSYQYVLAKEGLAWVVKEARLIVIS